MPELKRVEVAVDSFVLKNSGITVVMRRHAAAADSREAFYSAIAEGFTPRQLTMKFLKFLAASLMVSWDATEKDAAGNDVVSPITPQVLASMQDEDDYQQLLNEANSRLDVRGEQDAENFAPSSSPSSEDTSSKTRKKLPKS